MLSRVHATCSGIIIPLINKDEAIATHFFRAGVLEGRVSVLSRSRSAPVLCRRERSRKLGQGQSWSEGSN